MFLSEPLTICWMRWKLLPWKLKACSNSTLSSTVHSSGNGVKLAKSASERSTSCLCHSNMPRAWMYRFIYNTSLTLTRGKEKLFTVSLLYLLHVVAVFLFSHQDVLIHWDKRRRHGFKNRGEEEGDEQEGERWRVQGKEE